MKQESYRLINEAVKGNACLRIKDILADGKTEVVIRNSGNKSAEQRGLDWKWSTEIASSGIGGKFEDKKDNVHRVCKYKWAIPIFIRDDSFFAELYSIYVQRYKGDADRMKWFVDNQVSTEDFTCTQMAEYLTEKQRHYSGVGVALTNPDDLKLLMYEAR